MEEKHIDLGASHSERVDKIKEAHASGRELDAIEQAVEFTAPNGEFAKVADERSGNGASELEAFILGE